VIVFVNPSSYEVLLMLRALCLAMATVGLPLATASASAPSDPDPNAALNYWQAFSTLPKFTEAEQEKIHEYLTSPLDDRARQIVTQAEYSLTMLHQGAALRRCEWGVSPEQGINVRFTQAPASRLLAALACLRARIRFEEGKSAEAVDDIIDTLTLGRHMSLTGTNIMLLVGFAIEHLATETLACDLPKLDPGMIKDFKQRLDALPRGMNVATSLETEETFFLDWFVRIVKQAKDKESLVAALDFVNLEPEGKPSGSNAKARAFVEECGGTVTGMLRYAEETRAIYKQTEKMLNLPLHQFEKEFESQSVKRSSNPIYRVFFPAVVNMRRAQARMDVRRALLMAAISVQLEGSDAVKNHPDPVIGGPFEYVAFPGGFELLSKLKSRDDKPVTLTVGRRSTP
jgi:hypothetical protein